MRYAVDEENIIVGILPTGNAVTIEVLDLVADTLVPLTSNVCIESNIINGVYRWSTNNITNSGDYLNNYVVLLAKMTSSDGSIDYSKFIYGGFVDTIDLIMATK